MRPLWGLFQVPEEKRSDVDIGVTMLAQAVRDEYDTAVLVSGDTDFIPALEAVKTLFPHKRVGVLFPFCRANAEYRKVVTFKYWKTKLIQYQNCRLPDRIELANGSVITCPPEWAELPTSTTAGSGSASAVP